MAAASLPSGLPTPPLADLVRLFSSATLTGYVRRQEAPSFARETADCLPFWYDMSRRHHPDAGGVLTSQHAIRLSRMRAGAALSRAASHTIKGLAYPAGAID